MLGLALLVSFLWDHIFRFGLQRPDIAMMLGAAAMPLAAFAAARSKRDWDSILRWLIVAVVAELAGHWFLAHRPSFVWTVVLASFAQRVRGVKWVAWIPAMACEYGIAGYLLTRGAMRQNWKIYFAGAVIQALYQGWWYGALAAAAWYVCQRPDRLRLPRGLVGYTYAGHWLFLLLYLAAI